VSKIRVEKWRLKEKEYEQELKEMIK